MQAQAVCTAQDMQISQNAWCGVLVSCDGQLELSDSKIVSNAPALVQAVVRKRTTSTGAPLPPRPDGTETGASSLGTLRAWGGVVGIGKAHVGMRNCFVNKNHWHGIVFTGESTGRVDACTVSEQSRSGIAIEEQAVARIASSWIDCNQAPGIVFRGNTKGEACHNTLLLNSGSGIVAQGKSIVAMQHNSTSGHQTAGIGITGEATVTMMLNACTENHSYCAHGVLSQQDSTVEFITMDRSHFHFDSHMEPTQNEPANSP